MEADFDKSSPVEGGEGGGGGGGAGGKREKASSNLRSCLEQRGFS